MFLPTNILSAACTILYLPSLKNTMMSSMSEQLHTNSSFFRPVPMNPSARLMYSFWFASTTFEASMVSKLRISVRRG